VYSYPEYLDALCRTAGGSFRILAVLKGDEIHGGVGLYERATLGARFLSGRLLLYYNGLVLQHYSSKYPSENSSRILQVSSVVRDSISEIGYGYAEIRNRHDVTDLRPFLAGGWRARPSYSYLVSFSDKEGAFGRIEQNQRRLIRRAEEEGIVLSTDTDFDAFYRMHEGTHTRKGAPIYLPKPEFKRYFELLSSQGLCRLYHARMPNGRAVASQLVLLGGHPVTHSVSAAADPGFLRSGATPFLRWKVCEALAEEGYLGNDLTDAALNEVTRFKSQLGADLVVNSVLSTPRTARFRAARALSRLRDRGGSLINRAIRRAPFQRSS